MLLVTGITGHTGNFFLQELIKNKYKDPIRCIVRKNSDTSFLDNSGLEIEKVIGDLGSKDFIFKSMVGIKEVMHIYNIHYSPLIVEAAIKNNVERVILVHTTGIYSKFKEAAEDYINIEEKVTGMMNDIGCSTKMIIVRPSMIYGDMCDYNISKFIKLIDKNRIVPLIDGGKNLIQPVNARDLGKAFYTLLDTQRKFDNTMYILSGDKPVKMEKLFKLIAEKLDKKRTFINIPMGVATFIAKTIKLFTVGKLDYLEQVRRMGENRSYPHTEAYVDFGYRPMSLELGIEIEVNQYLRREL
jgi:nucleoside-diphosphate-sugar epimerase